MKPGELFSFYNKATWHFAFDAHDVRSGGLWTCFGDFNHMRSRGPPEVWCPVHPRGLRGDLRGSSTSVARPRTSGWCHPTVHQKRGFDTLSPNFWEKLPCHICTFCTFCTFSLFWSLRSASGLWASLNIPRWRSRWLPGPLSWPKMWATMPRVGDGGEESKDGSRSQARVHRYDVLKLEKLNRQNLSSANHFFRRLRTMQLPRVAPGSDTDR